MDQTDELDSEECINLDSHDDGTFLLLLLLLPFHSSFSSSFTAQGIQGEVFGGCRLYSVEL